MPMAGRSFVRLLFFTLTASDAMSFHHAPVVSFFGDLTRGREKGKRFGGLNGVIFFWQAEVGLNHVNNYSSCKMVKKFKIHSYIVHIMSWLKFDLTHLSTKSICPPDLSPRKWSKLKLLKS